MIKLCKKSTSTFLFICSEKCLQQDIGQSVYPLSAFFFLPFFPSNMLLTNMAHSWEKYSWKKAERSLRTSSLVLIVFFFSVFPFFGQTPRSKKCQGKVGWTLKATSMQNKIPISHSDFDIHWIEYQCIPLAIIFGQRDWFINNSGNRKNLSVL